MSATRTIHFRDRLESKRSFEEHQYYTIISFLVFFFERFISPSYILNFDFTTCPLCILWSCLHGFLLPWYYSSIFHLSHFCALLGSIEKYVCLIHTFLLVVVIFLFDFFFLVFLLVLPRSAKDKVWWNLIEHL